METKEFYFKRVKDLAESKGGKCLSKEFVNARSHMKWQCKEGHKWEATQNNISRGKWCPYCAGSIKLTLKEMKKIARSRGGKCLSKKYISSRSKLEWECKEGHKWFTTPSSVKHGSWCAKCYGNVKYDIKNIKELAKKRGGKCLSDKYDGSHSKLKWKCKEGHIWETIPNDIRQGKWCGICSGNVKLNLSEMKQIAKSRGGKCLSKTYTNSKTKLVWECKKGHHWDSRPGDIKRGQWCPVCNTKMSESICRKFFETIFSSKFRKIRPQWLMGDHGVPLELDGYCSDLKLAFEYQGRQHYEYIPLYHKYRSLSELKKMDSRKRKICKERKITLIEIPYTVKYEVMGDYIIRKCLERKIAVPKITTKVDHKLFDIYSDEYLEKMQEIAKSREGKCLSKQYLGSKIKMKWVCKLGHRWEANPDDVQRSTWCPKCAILNSGSTLRATIEEMQKLAKTKKGKCLSKKYGNAHTLLKWQCHKGHEWETSPSNIKNGTWCPRCSSAIRGLKRRLTIEEMKIIATSRKGKCLSKMYSGYDIKLSWQCEKGHKWLSTPNSIKHGSWCPQCAIDRSKKH